jgi:catechol 2,3-dioxygenase-like lactoylglutathione lyase family enzyme
MPDIERIGYIGLSVRDIAASARWYAELLNLTESYREENDDWTSVLLQHSSGLTIGLLQHVRNDGEPFSEFRTGLDHVEFEVQSEAELKAWRSRLDDLGIDHSGAFPHVVTFRDPDNIQLEFFWPGGMDSTSAP